MLSQKCYFEKYINKTENILTYQNVTSCYICGKKVIYFGLYYIFLITFLALQFSYILGQLLHSGFY